MASTGLAGEGAHEFVACTTLIRKKSKNAIIRACLEQRAIRAKVRTGANLLCASLVRDSPVKINAANNFSSHYCLPLPFCPSVPAAAPFFPPFFPPDRCPRSLCGEIAKESASSFRRSASSNVHLEARAGICFCRNITINAQDTRLRTRRT